MTTRSTKLVSFVSSGAGPTQLWKNPDGWVTLVKYAYMSNQGTAAVNPILYLQSSTGSTQVRLFIDPIPVGKTANWTGWAVMEASDVLAVYVDQAGFNIWVSGAVLPLTYPAHP